MIGEKGNNMYNDNCKQEVCSVPVPTDSMKNVILEIHENALKAREMAFDIYKNLFGTGTLPSSVDAGAKIECAFDAITDIKRIESDTLEVLYAVIGRIGD